MRTRTVLTWLEYAQFEQARQVLSEAGIPFERHGRHVHSSTEEPFNAFPTDAVELRVLEADLERARSLLSETVGRGVVGRPPS